MAITEVTSEVLADVKTPRDTRLSPDGKYVVYALRSFWVREKDNITASLWLAEIGKPNSSRQLTQGNYHDMSPVFSPDGKHIAFLSDRAKPGKASHLYLLPMKGGEALPLTNTEMEKGVGEYKWSPDGKSIAFTNPDEKTKEKKKKEEEKDDAKVYGEDWEFSRLRIISVGTKEIVMTLFMEDAHVSGIEWSPDSKEIAFASYKTPQLDDFLGDGRGGGDGATLRIADVENRETRVICLFPSMATNLTWHRDQLLWVSWVPVGSGSRIYQVSALAEKPEEAKHLAYGKNECGQAVRLCGEEVIVYVQEGLSDQLRVLQSKTLFSEECEINRGWDALVKDKQVTLVITKGATGVLEEVFSVVDGKSCQLSFHNKELADLKIGEGRALRCKAEDGLQLDGVICTPKALIGKKGPHPTAVIIHGGPYGRLTLGADSGFLWTEWMLSLGYMVILPNYRGSSSRGIEFAEMLHGEVDASYGDVVALVKQGIKDGIVDPKKVAVSGWSQGGFFTYLSITRDSTFHFAAGIAGAGISNWDAMAMTSDIPTFEKQLTGSAPWDGKQDENFRANPIFSVKEVTTPLLILHGEEDGRVPKEQAIGFHRGMLAHGKECQMVTYPREGHGHPVPFEKAHYLDMLKRIKEFLAKHLK